MINIKRILKYLLILGACMLLFTIFLSVFSFFNIIDNNIVQIILHIVLLVLVIYLSFKYNKNHYKDYLLFIFPVIIINTIIYLVFINDNFIKFLVFNTLLILITILAYRINIQKKDQN